MDYIENSKKELDTTLKSIHDHIGGLKTLLRDTDKALENKCATELKSHLENNKESIVKNITNNLLEKKQQLGGNADYTTVKNNIEILKNNHTNNNDIKELTITEDILSNNNFNTIHYIMFAIILFLLIVICYIMYNIFIKKNSLGECFQLN
tara:strand:+ start:3745 stop:4197 length:453 start_codon:yes stop_codon:yes gene_type:complete